MARHIPRSRGEITIRKFYSILIFLVFIAYAASLLDLVAGHLESTTISITGSRSHSTKAHRAYCSIGSSSIEIDALNTAARAVLIPTTHGTAGLAFVVKKYPGNCGN